MTWEGLGGVLGGHGGVLGGSLGDLGCVLEGLGMSWRGLGRVLWGLEALGGSWEGSWPDFGWITESVFPLAGKRLELSERSEA